MFTGIIGGLGEVNSINRSNRSSKKKPRADMGITLKIPVRLSKGLKVGDSISVNGTCLTVMNTRNKLVAFEMIWETTKRTCLGRLKKGDKVNIETSLRLGDRLDGHFVLGHTDGIGVIDLIDRGKGETNMWIKPSDHSIIPYIAPKGSIAIDGISLTVVNLDGNSKRFSVSLIPHTIENTTLGFKHQGDMVNIEIDVISRYVVNYQKIGSN
jgi:riboflavin synthase